MNNNTPAASLPPQQPAARVSPVPGLAAGAARTTLGRRPRAAARRMMAASQRAEKGSTRQNENASSASVHKASLREPQAQSAESPRQPRRAHEAQVRCGFG